MKDKTNRIKEDHAKAVAGNTTRPFDKTFIALALLLLTLTCFAYWNHFNNPFQYDDGFAVQNNPYIRDIKNIPLFFKDAATSCTYAPNQIYRPLNTTLNAIDCWIGGKGVPVPFTYHVSIFIAFLILGIFIYLLALKLYNTSFSHRLNRYIALLTVGVFLLHTANAETVNYIYERSDLASSLMVVVSLCVFFYFKNLRKYQLYLIPMLLGILIKEPAVMAAPFAFLYLFLFEENLGLNKLFSSATLRVLWKTLPAFMLALAVFAIEQNMSPSRWAAGSYLASSGSSERIPYLLTQPFVMVHYFNNFIFPTNLSADSQDWPLITNPLDEKVVFGFAFICFTLYLAYKASLQAKTRPITYGILWFYLALAPNSSIIPFPEVIRDLRTFFAFIGLTIAVVWALFLVYTKYETAISKSIAFKAGLILAISLFFMAHVYGVRQRCEVWGSEESLWKDVAIKSPANGRGLMYVGKILMAKGDYTGALDYLTRAKQAWPNYSYIQINLGVLYNAMQRYAESERCFKYALQLDPQNPDSYYYYAFALMGNGKTAEAGSLVDKGLQLNPAREDLAKLKTELSVPGSGKSKLQAMEDAVKNNPTADGWMSLSVEYYMNNRFEDCIRAAGESLKLHPDYDIAYNNICTANNALHQWDKAIEAGKKAVAISPGAELFKNNLKIAEDGKKNGK
jgi:tetratricopeptide (TPR) repeat protein